MLKATGDVESGIRSLIRGAIAAASRVPHLARIADRVQDLLHPPAPAVEAAQPPPQLALWVVDGEGLPPRPWRIYRDSIVACSTLGCSVPAHVCVARQQASELQTTHDTWRGTASEHPSCVTERCAQGRGVRAALDPNAGVSWSGTGPRGRMAGRGRRADRAAQEAAREALRRAGGLEEVRVLDVDPDPVEPVGEEG